MKYTKDKLGTKPCFLMVNAEQLKSLIADGVVDAVNKDNAVLKCVNFGGSSGDGWMDDNGAWYRGRGYKEITMDDLLINKKQTKMKTTTKAIPIAQARKWPSKDLVNGQKFTTAQGPIQIVKQASGAIWVVGNASCLTGGKPGRMPAGFKGSWSLGAYPTVDITCSGQLTAFKQVVDEEEKAIEFAQNFKVYGSSALLRAFKEEAEEAGWEFFGTAIPKTGEYWMTFEEGEFSVGNSSVNDSEYYLPDEWDDAIDDLNDKQEVDDVQYVECTLANAYEGGLSEGRVYEVVDRDDDEYAVLDDTGSREWWNKSNFKASTEEAFEDQGVNIKAVGGYKINIKEVKINGYLPMKMACIGCVDSQQVYSVGALRALYDAMCDDEATFDDEGVTFTKDQVDALIEALS